MKVSIDLSGLACVAEGEFNDYGYFLIDTLTADNGDDISVILGSMSLSVVIDEAVREALEPIGDDVPC
jgi:hypothetical protein